MTVASDADPFDRTEFGSTRDALHRVAVHVLARARRQATGRFSLRISPSGFGTPEFGSEARRIRVSGADIVIESDPPGGATAAARSIDGATLADLAAFAGVDMSETLDVGHDTPPVGELDEPLAVDRDAAAALAAWYADVSLALDRVITAVTPESPATLPRLWPEHFDVAIEVAAHPERRVNLGGSPGDGFCAEPYIYVGPWTSDRPGDPEFWNAPFGAYRPASSLDGDRVADGTAFLIAGLERLVDVRTG